MDTLKQINKHVDSIWPSLILYMDRYDKLLIYVLCVSAYVWVGVRVGVRVCENGGIS